MGARIQADEDGYLKVRDYVIAKARRYKIPRVTVSNRMLEQLNAAQCARLVDDLAEAGYILKIKEHNYGATLFSAIVEARAPRFGNDPTRD